MKTLGFKKVLVAVDVFTDSLAIEQKLFDSLRHLIGEDAVIEPICVTSDVSSEGHFPFIEKELNARMSRHLLASNVAPPKVICGNSMYPGSRSDRVRSLLKYIEEHDYDCMAAYSHSIEGQNDFILGSFIEPLIYNSPVPLVLVNPISRKIDTLERIFIPIEFREQELKHYSKMLESGVFADCDLYFYHHIYDHEYAMLKRVQSFHDEHKQRMDQEQERLMHTFEPLVKLARNRCRGVEFMIDVSSTKDRKAVDEHIRDLNPDLVLITRVISDSWQFFHSGFAKFILRNASAPVVCFPLKEND